ncbi:hypothetical protein DPEC_G00079830 [Dallia pectoralis]|uniref:Uncharacterized protein n=1 Tax=Dallia pectoralis TaxID=75939 RepID=A0ACC2H4I2_DALPE|nr:hypothetical protein DPEC_G00079830 [Dallia pectoralis]
MDPDSDNKPVTITNTTKPTVRFNDVAVIANRWMIDFKFISLCRFFKQENVKEFNKTISTLEAIIDGVQHLKAEQKKKRQICALLTRIMHGKHLAIHFDRDERLTPLMSAVGIWASLKETVADDALFQHVSNLLYVQCVAVCLDKGNVSMASSTLKWLEEDLEVPQNLTIKLSLIVSKSDTYHPFLSNFSWPRLLENIHVFLERFLEEHPSDFLFQAATKVVSVSLEREAQTGEESEDQEETDIAGDTTEHPNKIEESAVLIRPKKKLLSSRIIEPWTPGSTKRSVPHPRTIRASTRLTYIESPLSETSVDRTAISENTSVLNRTRRTHGRWSWCLDQALKAGVKQYGEGKWSKILLGHDFQGRTGVQLKDRWRILKKSGRVYST